MTILWKTNRETDDTESLLRKARNLLGPANGAEVNVGQNVEGAGQSVMGQKAETPMQYQVAEVLTTFDINDLLPSGKGKFDGKYFDIVADGEFIKKGEIIEIVQHEGSRIVVSRK